MDQSELQLHDIDVLAERILATSDTEYSIAARSLRGEARGILSRQAANAFHFLCARRLDLQHRRVAQYLERLERVAVRVENSNSTQSQHFRENLANLREQVAQYRPVCPEPLTQLLELSLTEARRAIVDDAEAVEIMRTTLTPSAHAWRALERLRECGRGALEDALTREGGFTYRPGMFDMGTPGLTLVERATVTAPGLAFEWDHQ